MAMICRNGARECDGCMACYPEPEIVGKCDGCGDEIHSDEDYFDINGELIHEDCLYSWAERYRVIKCASLL